MQTDILASRPRTDDGQLLDQAGNNIGRARIKAFLIVPTAAAGSVVFKDGGASGSTKMTINMLANSTNSDYIILPGEGVLFQTNIYVDVTSIASVMVWYGYVSCMATSGREEPQRRLERQGSGFLQRSQSGQTGVEAPPARGRQQARLFLCKDDWDEEKTHIREDSQRPKQSD